MGSRYQKACSPKRLYDDDQKIVFKDSRFLSHKITNQYSGSLLQKAPSYYGLDKNLILEINSWLKVHRQFPKRTISSMGFKFESRMMATNIKKKVNLVTRLRVPELDQSRTGRYDSDVAVGVC